MFIAIIAHMLSNLWDIAILTTFRKQTLHTLQTITLCCTIYLIKILILNNFFYSLLTSETTIEPFSFVFLFSFFLAAVHRSAKQCSINIYILYYRDRCLLLLLHITSLWLLFTLCSAGFCFVCCNKCILSNTTWNMTYLFLQFFVQKKDVKYSQTKKKKIFLIFY